MSKTLFSKKKPIIVKSLNLTEDDEDYYCSFCGNWVSKILNHVQSHKLKMKLHRNTMRAPNKKREIELLNTYYYNVQDTTRPKHLQIKDPRGEEDEKKE